MGYRVGVDVGGTFTDFVLLDEQSGETVLGKIPTTPADPSVAVLEGIDRLARERNIKVSDITQISHATTVGTNTVIQRVGPRTALLTTKGFRDVLLIGRQKRWELYDNSMDKPSPLVPRRNIWEVPERMFFDGSVSTPLDEDAMRGIAREMKDAGIEVVGICFLHAYANNAHERRAAEILAEEIPGIELTVSSDVSPVYREYERASTTVMNAYLLPPVSRYIQRLEDGLRGRGYAHTLYIMQSNGGIAAPEIVRKYPIRIIESGPAAGVLTALRYQEAVGTDKLLSFDMGGTTAKLCLLEEGRPSITGQFEVDMVHLKKNSGLPITIPSIDLVEIGSGGGSIASVAMGTIEVGPESAGSDPGPICYNRGGERITVTDANILLGYLNPEYFLGGEMELDIDKTRAAMAEQIAQPLGLSIELAAWGIHEVVTNQMAQAGHVVSVARGKDPRQFVLVAFGGAGPIHGARLARMLGCRRVVFPKGAGVQSALGLLTAEPVFDIARTHMMRLEADNLARINEIYADMEVQGHAEVNACRAGADVTIRRTADMRFVGQGYEISVPLPAGKFDSNSIEEIRETFFNEYSRLYGSRAFDRTSPIEGVHWRISATVSQPGPALESLSAGSGEASSAQKNTRQVYFPETNGFTECRIYDRYKLRANDVLEGPAIVEERETTVVIPPMSRARMDHEGNIILDLD